MNRKVLLSALLLGLIFCFGVFLRIWYFGVFPSGLHQDEASIAVEATSLYHFGEDRNGQSFPAHFIAWGSGQNALYGYILMLLVPWGLTPETIRLPMLLTGLLSIPLIYFIGRKIFSPLTGVLAALLLAISPWHIMLSRWALESNILPFVFLLGFCCIINFDRGWLWMVAGFIFLGISLYAYGTAYFLVPLFLLLFLAILLPQRRFAWWQVGIGLLVFFLIALPIGLFIVINSFSLPAMRLGVISIPRLPADPRYEVLTGILHGGGLLSYVKNFYSLIRILFLQTDGLITNLLPAFGFLFAGAILFSLMGMGRIIQEWKGNHSPQRILFLGWLVLAFLLGIVQPPVVNRINVLFPCLILLVAYCLEKLWRQEKAVFCALTLGLLVSTLLFGWEYFRMKDQEKNGLAFYSGFLSALKQIPAENDLPVCVSTSVNMPYIFVLLLHPENPSVLAANINYVNPHEAFRVVDRYGNYYFDASICPATDRQYWIVQQGSESIPDSWHLLFTVEKFGDFVLYIPKNP